MKTTKKATQSVTIISAIAVLIATALNGLFGNVTNATEIVDIITTTIQIVGSFGAIYGRIKAETTITY